MSDLISRRAVIKVLKETGIIQDNDLGHLVVEEINRIPTAYDPDKVVEELEKEMERSEDRCDWGARFKAFRDAIEIVKGGVE